MKVPMLDLGEQYETLQQEINEAVQQVMASSRFILGPHVKRLEQDVAAYSRVSNGVGVASGSDALHLSLAACGVEKGDEVIVPAFTFFATAGAVARIGASPVFVDIDPLTYNIDPNKVEEAITPKTKAIIPVHLYGQMADMTAINEMANKNGIAVIEDAAQAIGAEYKGKRAGEYGTTTCFSFFPTKNLGAYGDAGLIVTNDDDLAEKVRILRTHGSKPKYYHHVLGYNSRLDELQAAILNVKFPRLDEWNQMRRDNAQYYSRLICDKLSQIVTTPYEAEDRLHIYHQYTIRVPERDQLQTFLKENGVSTMVYYPKPLHLQPVFKDLCYEEGDLPVTETACREVLSLPMFPELKKEQQRYIVNLMEQFYLRRPSD